MNSEKQHNQDKPVLKVNKPATLQLTKTVETGRVQQNISRGRSKTIMVEVRKTRTFSRDQSGQMVEEVRKAEAPGVPESVFEKQERERLTEHEREARLKALKESEIREKEIQAAPLSSKPEKKKAKPAKKETVPPPAIKGEEEEAASYTKKSKKLGVQEGKGAGKPRGEIKQRYSKLTLANALEQEERMRSLASVRRSREKAKRSSEPKKQTEHEFFVREVVVPEAITVQELANRMAVRGVDVVKSLMKLGVMATVNSSIDADTAELLVTEFGHKIKRVTEADVENVILEDAKEDESLTQPRPPVVTIMGHVDHGKTTLLDALRATDVAAHEAGGITQHIGAYQVTMPTGSKITFLDTPGHAAFTAMRARGAKVTDIVVLVVAADDGIMPQTEEAISHAKAAGVPIIVAINKIDKPGADPKKAKEALLSYELIPEEFGGETIIVEVSALKKMNLDKLEEAILLQSELLNLRANPNRKAAGSVVEAKIDKGKGNIATLLVQKGTLRPGDIVVAGTAYGRIRAITDDKGKTLKEAMPSQPVEVQGLTSLPEAGDAFAVTDNEKQAREITAFRFKKIRDIKAADNMPKLDNLFQTASGIKTLPVIVKADVQGSVEAIVSSIEKLSNEKVEVKVIHAAAGGISESDVTLAKTTSSRILAFNVRASAKAKEMATSDNIPIQYYAIIYDLMDDMKAAVSGLLEPVIRELFLGNAEILQVFKVSKVGKVAGCKVTQGVVKRGAGVRLIRDNVVIHTGKLKTLKRFKDEASEVREGTECGMAFENYDNIQVGDTIEAFELVEEKQSIPA